MLLEELGEGSGEGGNVVERQLVSVERLEDNAESLGYAKSGKKSNWCGEVGYYATCLSHVIHVKVGLEDSLLIYCICCSV